MTSKLEITLIDGIEAVKSDSKICVAIYTLDNDNSINMIGLYSEKNPHFNEDYVKFVMDKIEKNDNSILSKAKNIVKTRCGYDISDSLKWTYLGEFFTSDEIVSSVYCYGVDVTGLEEIKTSDFNLKNVNEIRTVKDSVTQACFFRLFINLYKKDLI